MDNNITIQNTISIGIEIPPETFINEKTINVQNLIIESSSTNNGTICIPDNVSNNIVVPSKKKKIFIVHGHDNEVKLEVARFIEKIGLEPIILHEQVNSGMTVIEKIEKYSDVEFGIVLYTPCDLGYVKGKKKEKVLINSFVLKNDDAFEAEQTKGKSYFLPTVNPKAW